MERSISKPFVIALILALAFTVMAGITQTVYADSGDPALVKGTSVLAKNVSKDGLQRIWFGRYLEPATKRRMWYVIGYDGQGSNPASRKNLITILHRNIPFGGGERFSGYSEVSYANQYAAANIRWIVNSYYNGIGDWKWNDSKEKEIIVKRTLEGGGGNYGQEGYDENKIKGNSVEDAGFWLLSCGEAEALPGGIRHLGNDNTWWLRSPGEYDSKAAYCWTDYNYDFTAVIKDGVSTDTFRGVRPACDLDMNAILFTSAAEGGKSSGSGADALTTVGNNKNSEWKLTIMDAGRSDFDIETCEGSYNVESGVVKLRYSGARKESNSYISAIITGEDDSVRYYGRIAAVSEQSGQVTINTSGKMESGDKLYVFNEQYNGDKITDYASDLKEVRLPAAGSHKWAEATCVDPKKCEICGIIASPELGHEYRDVDGTMAAATCTEAGKGPDRKCTRCGDVIEGTEIPPLGHDWGDWRVWTTTGNVIHKQRSCQRDGCDAVEEITIENEHEHTYPSMGFCEEVQATCTTNGIRAHYECSCGQWFEVGPDGGPEGDPETSDNFVIPASGHEWEAATCTQPKTCVRCGETKGDPIGHDREFTGWTWVGNEEKGYSEAIAEYVCIREGCGDIRKLRITPSTRVVQPTCMEYGETVYRVQINSINAPDLRSRSAEKVAKITEPLGHDYQEVKDSAAAATCTEPGKEADLKCSRCGAVIDGRIIPATGHDWGSWEETKPASEAEEGEEARRCSRCDRSETRTIPKVGHTHKLRYVDPEDATCMKTGHIGYWVCDQGEQPCMRCFSDESGETEIDTEDTIIYPAGHTAGLAVRENETAASCTENGTFEEVVYCTECGTELRRTRFATPAHGHTPGEPETEDVIPATCTEDGSCHEIVKCEVCGETAEETLTIIPVSGHEWSRWIIIKPATVTEEGEKLRNCGRCKETERQVIPKLISIEGEKAVLSKTAFTYSGKAIKPSIKTVGGRKLEAGTDYTVKWSDKSSRDVGSYSVTITGTGSYTGTAAVAKYKINPKGTSVARLTKAKKAVTVKWNKQSAKMSRSRITGYQIQLATNKAFTRNRKLVTVKGWKNVSKKVTKLKGNKKYYVRVRTFMTTGGSRYCSKWSKVSTVKTK